jgi:BCCT, betaine/carnitine/choline family transporter
MVFAAGVAVGLFVYGTAEPLWHQSSNFFAKEGYHSQDEIDLFAINLTVNHWGIMGWVDYVIVAIAMGLLQYKFGLPPSFRSIFYPIFGEYTFGWIGDVIDIGGIVVTMAGICTSLGLGAMHIVSGFQYMNWIENIRSVERLTAIQNVVVWWLTVCTALSAISGVYSGIRILSIVAFVLGSVLMFLVFCMDDSKFLLNLQVQEFGKCNFVISDGFIEEDVVVVVVAATTNAAYDDGDELGCESGGIRKVHNATHHYQFFSFTLAPELMQATTCNTRSLSSTSSPMPLVSFVRTAGEPLMGRHRRYGGWMPGQSFTKRGGTYTELHCLKMIVLRDSITI